MLELLEIGTLTPSTINGGPEGFVEHWFEIVGASGVEHLLLEGKGVEMTLLIANDSYLCCSWGWSINGFNNFYESWLIVF